MGYLYELASTPSAYVKPAYYDAHPPQRSNEPVCIPFGSDKQQHCVLWEPDEVRCEAPVFYFHGGAFVNQPNNQQLTMAARTAKETGSEVVLMVYPKIPVYDCAYAYDVCIRYYLDYIQKNDCGRIVFMGDSAGGGLALGLAEALRDGKERMPEALVLISPWADLTMSNPDMAESVY